MTTTTTFLSNVHKNLPTIPLQPPFWRYKKSNLRDNTFPLSPFIKQNLIIRCIRYMKVTNSWRTNGSQLLSIVVFLPSWLLLLLPLHTIPGTFMFNSQFQINVLSRHDYYNPTELNLPQRKSNVVRAVAINILSGLVKFWFKQSQWMNINKW